MAELIAMPNAGVQDERDEHGRRSAPEKRGDKHPDGLFFQAIDPERQQHVERHRQHREHHAEHEADWSGREAQQQEHQQPEEQR
jgi:hypothetical protein